MSDAAGRGGLLLLLSAAQPPLTRAEDSCCLTGVGVLPLLRPADLLLLLRAAAGNNPEVEVVLPLAAAALRWEGLPRANLGGCERIRTQHVTAQRSVAQT